MNHRLSEKNSILVNNAVENKHRITGANCYFESVAINDNKHLHTQVLKNAQKIKKYQ